MDTQSKDFSTIIVGAGPSGLLLALLLAKQGIKTTVIEKSTELDKQPRASFYNAPALHEFERAGIMDDVDAASFCAKGASWRRIDASPICTIYEDDLPFEMRRVSLPLAELLPLVKRHLDLCESAQLLLGHEVVSVGQDKKEAWVNVKTEDGEKKLHATYIVGCDGGSSKIRRELFGTGNFPGKTWDVQLVATNVYYPGLAKHNYTEDTNFVVHPNHFSMIARLKSDGLLRITYGEEAGLTREELLARQPQKYKQFVPGAPDPSEYEIKNFSPYKIHQRCAESFKVGRFLLAADAAHLCNPFGGLGLTGGFADVGGLYDCLYGIYTGRADDSILEKYDEIRREKYWKVIDPISSSNLQKLWDPSDEAVEKDEFFQVVKRAETDRELAKKMSEMGLFKTIMHDFTQYYH